MIKTKQENWILILTMILLAVFSFLIFQEKNGFHIDEVYSYGLSNSDHEPFPWQVDEWLEGDYYKDYLTPTEETRFNYDSVIYNQVQDVHPPFYYLIFHTVSSFFPGVFTKYTGLVINLIIHLVLFFIVCRLIYYFTKNFIVSLSGSLFWYLSLAALNAMTFIRMYSLFTLLVAGLYYFTFKYLEEKKNKYLLPLGICYFLGGWTHYYFYIFAFFFTLTVCLFFLLKREWTKTLLFGGTAGLSVILALLSFPAVFEHIQHSNRGQEVLEGIEQNLTQVSGQYFTFIHEELFTNIPVVILLLVFFLMAGSVLIHNRSKNMAWAQWGLLILPVISYVIVVQNVSGLQSPRYIYPIYPLLVIFMYSLLYAGLSSWMTRKGCLSLFILAGTLLLIPFRLYDAKLAYQFKEVDYPQEVIANIEEETALIIYQEKWQLTQYVLGVKDFKSIYPTKISSQMDEALPDSLPEASDDLYVFIDVGVGSGPANVVETISDFYAYSTTQEILRTEHYVLYQLDK